MPRARDLVREELVAAAKADVDRDKLAVSGASLGHALIGEHQLCEEVRYRALYKASGTSHRSTPFWTTGPGPTAGVVSRRERSTPQAPCFTFLRLRILSSVHLLFLRMPLGEVEPRLILNGAFRHVPKHHEMPLAASVARQPFASGR
ncbi:hypothetical protein CA601_42990 [Paraburkholderia hospita]|nr:hypothetical protein CA601_42990 [Paraburkholderia hospita]